MDFTTPLLTVKQAAELLAVSEKTVRRMIKAGKLEYSLINGHIIRIHPSTIEAIINGKSTTS